MYNTQLDLIEDTTTGIDPDDVIAITESVVMELPNPRKMEYLGYRAAGFKVREACQLAKLHQRTVMHWREHDPEFYKQEHDALTTMRHTVATEMLNMKFTRNMTMFMERDFKLLAKASRTPEELTKPDNDYLTRCRAMYTPQQLQIISQMLGVNGGNEPSFTDLVKRLSQARDEVTLSRTTREEVTLTRGE